MLEVLCWDDLWIVGCCEVFLGVTFHLLVGLCFYAVLVGDWLRCVFWVECCRRWM